MPSIFSRLGQAARILTGREERGIPPPSAVFTSQYGIPALFNPGESLKAYGDNVHLYRAVLSIAMEIARIPLRLQTENSKGEIQVIKSHQALETLRFPQPIQGGKSLLSAMDLKLVTLMHVLLEGEGFWNLDRRLKVNKAPTKVNILMPGNMELRLDGQSDLAEYRYRVSNREIVMDPMDVVHFKIPDPLNWLRGHAPTQAIRYSIDAHLEADKMQFKKLKNSALPGGLLRTDKKIDDVQRRKYLAAWNQMYGGGNNTGKTAFLPEGIEFQPVQQTNQEMQFVEGKQLNRDEILTAYGVGLEIFGKTESQTRANAEAAIFVFTRFGVLPYLEKFVDTLNNDFLPAFPGTDGLTFAFNDPVPENMEEKRQNGLVGFQTGSLTPNEFRKMLGLEPLKLPGMDVTYLDMGKVAIGADPPLA
jgi:HK97 family phage portal protein